MKEAVITKLGELEPPSLTMRMKKYIVHQAVVIYGEGVLMVVIGSL